MEVMTFIKQSYNEVFDRVVASCRGLDAQEMAWRPAPNTNSIAFILWHMARAEDRIITAASGASQEVWLSQAWYGRFGLSVEQAGIREDAALRDRKAFPPPEALLGYLEAVHRATLQRLAAIRPQDFARPTDPARPERSVGATLRHLIIHGSNHHGQIDYLRGLMDAGWNLPAGTGMAQG